MAKKKKGLAPFLPPDWGDWTQEEKEDWLSYPDKDKKRRKRKLYAGGSLTPASRY